METKGLDNKNTKKLRSLLLEGGWTILKNLIPEYEYGGTQKFTGTDQREI
jgi:hypothetical protein